MWECGEVLACWTKHSTHTSTCCGEPLTFACVTHQQLFLEPCSNCNYVLSDLTLSMSVASEFTAGSYGVGQDITHAWYVAEDLLWGCPLRLQCQVRWLRMCVSSPALVYGCVWRTHSRPVEETPLFCEVSYSMSAQCLPYLPWSEHALGVLCMLLKADLLVVW